MKIKALTILGILVSTTGCLAAEPSALICYENMSLETGMKFCDGDTLIIRLDTEKKTASSHTESAWGGQNLGSTSIMMDSKASPIQRIITSVGEDGVATDALRLKINGSLPPFSDKTPLKEGAPGESLIKYINGAGKIEFVTSLLNCFSL